MDADALENKTVSRFSWCLEGGLPFKASDLVCEGCGRDNNKATMLKGILAGREDSICVSPRHVFLGDMLTPELLE